MHVFLHHKSSWLPHFSMLRVNDLLGLDQRLSHSKMDPSKPFSVKARSGWKTLIYDTTAGIDPHRINRTKLPSWCIVGPCYCSTPPVNFPPFPSRSALHAVGQSNRTALQLLPACLISLAPPPLTTPHHAPITFLIRWWFPPSSWSSAGVRGARTCCQHKMVLNQVDGELRNTIKA